MGRGLVAGAVLVGLIAVVPSADGQVRIRRPERQVDVRSSGAITVTWQGDQARGCALEGVCAIRGSIAYRPDGEGHINLPDGRGGAPNISSLSLTLDNQAPAVVRVLRRDPASQASVCVDTVSLEPVDLVLPPAAADTLRLGLGAGLSAGRCTGPTILDLARAMPAASIALRRLGRVAQVVSLTGRRHFDAGPFAGEVSSTVRLHVGRSHRQPGSPLLLTSAPAQRRAFHIASIQLVYRLERLSGALVTSFRGAASPACETLDACGLAGTTAYAMPGAGGSFAIEGERLVPAGVHGGFRAVLRAARAGRLDLEGELDFERPIARVLERAVRGAGPACVDGAVGEPRGIAFQSARRELGVTLGSPNLIGFDDSLRTRCPGPSETDASVGGVLARGAIPLASLGHRTLRATLSPSHPRFSAPAYTGTRTGSLDVVLRLVRARGGVHTVVLGR